MDRLVPAEGKLPLQVNDHAFKASALGGKDHAMRLKGFIGTGTDVRSIVLGNGPGKGIHQTEVTSTVSPENAGIGRPWIDHGFFAIQETMSGDRVAVTDQLAFRTEDTRRPVGLGV